MALSGSVRTSEYEGRSVTLNWSATQDIASNSSTISWSLVGSGSAGGWVMVSELSAAINGTSVYYRSSSNHTECWIGTTLASGSTVIYHNSDGSKSFSASVSAGVYQWSINVSGSSSFTLDTIPRASSIGTVTGNTLGSQITVNINRVVSSFTHQMWYKVGNAVWVDLGKNIGTQKSFTPDIGFSSQFTNATSGTMQICLRTYSGTTRIGSDVYKNVRVNVPSSVVPTITSIELTDPTGNKDNFGGYVQGKSKLKVQVSANGIYGSSIGSVIINANGVTTTTNPYTSNTITVGGGSKTVNVAVVDSRGRNATSTATYTVLSYTSPTITKLTARRCDADGNSDDSGAYMKITYAGSITPLNNNNSKNLLVRYRPQKTTTWINAVNVNEYSRDSEVIVEADVNKTYDISFVVTDSFGSTEKTWSVSTAFTLMDFNSSGKGIAFGKVSEQNALECALDVIFTKKIQGLYPIGSVYISVNNTNPSTYFGGTWEQIKDKFLLASGDTYSAGTTGGEATHTLTVAEMPSHDGHMYDNMNDGGWVDRGGDTNSYFLNSTGAVGFGTYENRPWKVVSGNELVMQGYSKGGGQAHNNMPPYISVYVWKRTA